MGPIVLVAALSLFPFLNARYSALGLLRTTAVVFAFDYALFSLLPDIVTSPVSSASNGQIAVLCILMGVRFATNVIAYTSAGVLVRVPIDVERGPY